MEEVSRKPASTTPKAFLKVEEKPMHIDKPIVIKSESQSASANHPVAPKKNIWLVVDIDKYLGNIPKMSSQEKINLQEKVWRPEQTYIFPKAANLSKRYANSCSYKWLKK